MNKILLNEPFTKWLFVERRHSAYRGLLKPNRICRLGETSELSTQEIHVHQFVHSTSNLRRQGQCSIKKGVDDQEHPRKTEYRLDVLRAINGAHIEVY